MAWKYEQSTGRLYYGSELVETGYSGSLTNKNNPDRQQVKGMGPLPRGTYRIAGHSRSKGPAPLFWSKLLGIPLVVLPSVFMANA